MTDATGNGESAQDFYGRWARLYDVIARRTPGIGRLRSRVANTCRLEPGDTVVEMGCGTGANLPNLSKAVGPTGTVVGLDFTDGVLRRARAATVGYDNVHVLRADATAPPIAGEIDAVIATFVVGMLENPVSAVDEWCDLVEPGGHVVLANAARSDEPYGPAVNAVFRAVVVLSTPPTTRLRYEEDLVRTLDERIGAAHDRLRDRSSAVAHETHLFGTVRLSGGRIE